MNLRNKLSNKYYGAMALMATALAPAIAFAQATDPSDQVVTAVQTGGANGAKVAVAVVIAVWGITAIYLMRRKS